MNEGNKVVTMATELLFCLLTYFIMGICFINIFFYVSIELCHSSYADSYISTHRIKAHYLTFADEYLPNQTGCNESRFLMYPHNVFFRC